MMTAGKSTVLFLAFLCAWTVQAGRPGPDDDLVVSTANGKVRGGSLGTTNRGRKHIYSWRGIPFAEPPLDDLRFEAPVPVRNWDGVLDVSRPKPICLQGSGDDIAGSEDCLYLQIYSTQSPRKKANLPVLVWIHGGAFFLGAADFDKHGADYLLDEDVIVAAIHYRVGAFGFLSTGDSNLRGNAGLKDQILALKWLKANIRSFGGNPDKITLIGQSAGAASIAYLLQAKQTEGLFHGAIMLSGHSLSQWGLNRSPLDFARSVARKVSVSTLTKRRLVEGLKKVDAHALQNAASDRFSSYVITSNALHGLALGPVIEEGEGAVVTGNSHEKIKNGEFHKVPIILGHTSNEPLMGDLSVVVKAFLFIFDLDVSRLVPASLNSNALLGPLIGQSIKSAYFGLRLISSSVERLMKFIHDDQFERSIHQAAKLYSQHTNTYVYNFTHEGPLYGVTEREDRGVGHTEDLGYLFDYGHKGSHVDYLVRDIYVRLFTNFAKYQNPTPKPEQILGRTTWNPCKGDQINVLQVGKELKVLENPDREYDDFWEQLFDRRGRGPFCTY